MTTTDQLPAIEARLTADEAEYGAGMHDQTIRDRRALLALIREQAAKLAAVTTILDEWASYKPFPDAEESQRWYSLGKRHAADAIRTALTATEGAL